VDGRVDGRVDDGVDGAPCVGQCRQPICWITFKLRYFMYMLMKIKIIVYRLVGKARAISL
jgi:hypothetical protein